MDIWNKHELEKGFVGSVFRIETMHQPLSLLNLHSEFYNYFAYTLDWRARRFYCFLINNSINIVSSGHQ